MSRMEEHHRIRDRHSHSNLFSIYFRLMGLISGSLDKFSESYSEFFGN